MPAIGFGTHIATLETSFTRTNHFVPEIVVNTSVPTNCVALHIVHGDFTVPVPYDCDLEASPGRLTIQTAIDSDGPPVTASKTAVTAGVVDQIVMVPTDAHIIEANAAP
ncbi:unnamed protein product [Cuscuta europaea]|uniref:Uncharacterized protein n=1 Tax=Cuscuta europaea TaxID=41803 RepID=A0A9P0Z3S9_CUSEU|nr:unnamed protein product [Cuscuta europaea]